VLEEAANPRHPLLERLRFVAISASNLDEFYSVRVAGLIGQERAGISTPSADGLTPAQALAAIHTDAQRLIAAQQDAWHELRTLLAEAGLQVCTSAQLTEADRAWLETWFMDRVFPVLTPARGRPRASLPLHRQPALCMVLKLVREEDGGTMRALLPLAPPDRALHPPARRPWREGRHQVRSCSRT
jgi:polyphosphate kinase